MAVYGMLAISIQRIRKLEMSCHENLMASMQVWSAHSSGGLSPKAVVLK